MRARSESTRPSPGEATTNTAKRKPKYRVTITLLALCVLAAGLATVAASPVGGLSLGPRRGITFCYVNDNPAYGPPKDGSSNWIWLAGEPASSGKGYGDGKYGKQRSNYIYTSAEGRDPTGSRASWDLGDFREIPEFEIDIFVPKDATARVKYQVKYTLMYDQFNVVYDATSRWVDQADINDGWHTLSFSIDIGWSEAPERINVALEVHYDDSDYAIGRERTDLWRRLGVDAARIRTYTLPYRPIHQDENEKTGCEIETQEVDVGPIPTAEPTPLPTPEITPPSPPVNLTLLTNDNNKLWVEWRSPLDDGGSKIIGYTLTITRLGRTFGPYELSANSFRYSPPFYPLSGTTYTVEMSAVNSVGISRPARDSTTTKKATPPSAPRNLRLSVTKDNKLKVTWEPPSDQGRSRITGYTLTITRPNGPDGTEPKKWVYNRPANAHSYTPINPIPGATYTARLAARNRAGTGRSTSAELEIDCPDDGKYKIKVEKRLNLYGLPKLPTRYVVALKQFQTIDKKIVQVGERGGEVSGTNNLSQDGCSWITVNAVVHDEAKVEKRALISGKAIVRNGATISGDARVYENAVVADNANVSGYAQVYGHARVYGYAQVDGDAKVENQAHVFGSLSVGGTAHIGNKMKIDEGVFDGKQEHIRAAREMSRAAIGHALYALDECPIAGASSRFANLRSLLGYNAYYKGWKWVTEWTLSRGCGHLKMFRDIIKAITPTPFELAIDVLSPFVGRLSKLTSMLISLIDTAQNYGSLKKASDILAEFVEHIDEQYPNVLTEEIDKCKKNDYTACDDYIEDYVG